MEFILINPGSMIVGKFQPPYPVAEDTIKNAEQSLVMWMGDGRGYNNEEFRQAKEYATRDARPGFKIRIERPYYMGKFEVTQAQWKKIMKNNPSVFQDGKIINSDNYPVENVTSKSIHKFLLRLNKLEQGKEYRLPTEFEWEYSARAGAKADILWSEITASAQLGTTTTQPVGQKKPNAWGLYDMLGNVWETVQDYYNEKTFADPKPPRKGKHKVLKGASFVGDVKNATYLTHSGGPGNGWDVGFRIVMTMEEQ